MRKCTSFGADPHPTLFACTVKLIFESEGKLSPVFQLAHAKMLRMQKKDNLREIITIREEISSREAFMSGYEKNTRQKAERKCYEKIPFS
jgi:hypothetical protein